MRCILQIDLVEGAGPKENRSLPIQRLQSLVLPDF